MLFLLQAEPSESFFGLDPATAMPLMFGIIIAIFYFISIRPMQKQERDRKAMLDRLKKNDHVLTRGGIYGIVMNVKNEEVVLKIDQAQNVKVRVAKSAIESVVEEEAEKEKEKEKGQEPGSGTGREREAKESEKS